VALPPGHARWKTGGVGGSHRSKLSLTVTKELEWQPDFP